MLKTSSHQPPNSKKLETKIKHSASHILSSYIHLQIASGLVDQNQYRLEVMRPSF